jgi:hypothetical protein
MDDAFLNKIILPVGESLTPLPTPQLRPLAEHPLAAGRAVGAAALAQQFLTFRRGSPAKTAAPTGKDLRKFARDPRPDVRAALTLALSLRAKDAPDTLFNLGKPWLQDPSPRVRCTVLGFLPALAESYGEEIVTLLAPLGAEADREVRAALADALNALGRAGLAGPVLGLVSRWEAEPASNSWVIRRVRGASWAQRAEKSDQ